MRKAIIVNTIDKGMPVSRGVVERLGQMRAPKQLHGRNIHLWPIHGEVPRKDAGVSGTVAGTIAEEVTPNTVGPLAKTHSFH